MDLPGAGYDEYSRVLNTGKGHLSSNSLAYRWMIFNMPAPIV